MDPIKLEVSYRECIEHLPEYIPDGIIEADILFLHSLGLLKSLHEEGNDNQAFTNAFQMIETPDKVTLFNEKFVIWIVPQLVEENPTTFAIIAMQNENSIPSPEVAFSVSGIYNSSYLVLKILESLLLEIEENEEVLEHLEEAS
ncbi:MAG: hypothetical protein ACQEP8_03110 [Chlamydiota bacterium]